LAETPDGLLASKYTESRQMEDEPKKPAADTTKDPNPDQKAGSDSGEDSRQAAPQSSTKQSSTTQDAASQDAASQDTASQDAASQDTASQGAAGQGATKESGESPAGNSAENANRNSASESAGKPPAPENADRGAGSTLDPKMQALVETKIDARLNSLLESHLEPLLAVNRQLALFLGEQLGNMIELRQSVCAMERLLEADPRRKSKYAAMLEKVKGEGAGTGDPHWINRTRGMLSRLERTGTLGPKSDDEPARV
jgi:hypothetical protein